MPKEAPIGASGAEAKVKPTLTRNVPRLANQAGDGVLDFVHVIEDTTTPGLSHPSIADFASKTTRTPSALSRRLNSSARSYSISLDPA